MDDNIGLFILSPQTKEIIVKKLDENLDQLRIAREQFLPKSGQLYYLPENLKKSTEFETMVDKGQLEVIDRINNQEKIIKKYKEILKGINFTELQDQLNGSGEGEKINKEDIKILSAVVIFCNLLQKNEFIMNYFYENMLYLIGYIKNNTNNSILNAFDILQTIGGDDYYNFIYIAKTVYKYFSKKELMGISLDILTSDMYYQCVFIIFTLKYEDPDKYEDLINVLNKKAIFDSLLKPEHDYISILFNSLKEINILISSVPWRRTNRTRKTRQKHKKQKTRRKHKKQTSKRHTRKKGGMPKDASAAKSVKHNKTPYLKPKKKEHAQAVAEKMKIMGWKTSNEIVKLIHRALFRRMNSVFAEIPANEPMPDGPRETECKDLVTYHKDMILQINKYSVPGVMLEGSSTSDKNLLKKYEELLKKCQDDTYSISNGPKGPPALKDNAGSVDDNGDDEEEEEEVGGPSGKPAEDNVNILIPAQIECGVMPLDCNDENDQLAEEGGGSGGSGGSGRERRRERRERRRRERREREGAEEGAEGAEEGAEGEEEEEEEEGWGE